LEKERKKNLPEQKEKKKKSTFFKSKENITKGTTPDNSFLYS
tara:strand:- start:457 stop:582 length:126 start_codon:yes stop_codon:yes gene_type:complete